jgi:mRNA interferase HigB
MRIIAKRILKEFWKRYPDAEGPLKSWYYSVKAANWNHPSEALVEFPSVRNIGVTRLIFNIKGNKYRLIVRVNYAHQIMLIRFIGTHAEYDRIDAKTI